jgi:putative peptide zinc metalloprotease protein
VAIWILASPTGTLRSLMALMLTSYHLAAFMNLIPFIQLDGYHMLALMMGRPLLRVESRKYAWQRILEAIHLRPKREDAFTRVEKGVLLTYALLSTIATIAFLSMIAAWWHRGFAKWLGEGYGWVAVICLLATMLFGRKAFNWVRERVRGWSQERQPAAADPAAPPGGGE